MSKLAMFDRARRAISEKSVRRFLRDESGATSIEYAIIASGIAVAIAATIVSLGSSVKGMYSNVLTSMK
ncbi:MAG TPA: Flp family type IVb pilin [Xanthobacteraceae bacterium]|nr:Flp family type IVb pilin [Xanthobacteraceae bacterium]